MDQSALLGLVVALVVVSAGVQAACPSSQQQLQSSISQCVALVGVDYSSEGTLAFCNGTAQNAISCVRTILDDCAAVSQESADAVLNTIDFETLKMSLGMACNNTEVIEANAQCIDDRKDMAKECIAQTFEIYSRRQALLRSRGFDNGRNWYLAEVKKSVCLYQVSLAVCAEPYLTTCNSEVHGIYSALFTSITIPNCDAVLSAINATAPEDDGCPLNGRETVVLASHCTIPFRPITDFSQGLPTVDNVLDFCNNDAEKMTRCLQHLQTCAQTYPAVKTRLAEALNVDSLNYFMTVACLNKNLLNEMKACVQPLETEADTCAVREYTLYGDGVRDARLQTTAGGGESFRLRVLRLGCNYIENLKTCVEPYKSQCTLTLGRVFEALITAADSPACANLPAEGAPTTTTTTTTTEVIFTEPILGGLE